MNRLEQGYRRLLLLYARAHRQARTDEMLAVLLDAAPPEQRAVAETVDLVRGAASARASRLGRRAARHPGTTAAAVTLVLTISLAVVTGAPPDPAPARALPDTLAGYSPLAATVDQSPPGPAVAIYRQGSGAELFDAPQAVVAGASGAYRRLDLAERRGGMHVGGSEQTRFEARQVNPAPTTLSPDGTRVAVGGPLGGSTDSTAGPVGRGTVVSDDAVGSGLDVAVQDLTTGEVVRHVLGDGRDALPVAWSPDGRRLAVQDEAGALRVVDLADGSVADLGRPDLHLTSGGARSPDGALLLGMRRSRGGGTGCIAFISLTVAPAPDCLPGSRYALSSVLGWTGERSIAITAERGAADGGIEAVDVLGVDVRDGSARQTSSIPSWGGDVTAYAVDVAGGILLARDTAAAPATDRDRWPVALRVLTVVLAAAPAALFAHVGAAAGRSLRRAAAR